MTLTVLSHKDFMHIHCSLLMSYCSQLHDFIYVFIKNVLHNNNCQGCPTEISAWLLLPPQCQLPLNILKVCLMCQDVSRSEHESAWHCSIGHLTRTVWLALFRQKKNNRRRKYVRRKWQSCSHVAVKVCTGVWLMHRPTCTIGVALPASCHHVPHLQAAPLLASLTGGSSPIFNNTKKNWHYICQVFVYGFD